MSNVLDLKMLHLMARSMEYDEFKSYVAQQMGGIPSTADPTEFINRVRLVVFDRGWPVNDWETKLIENEDTNDNPLNDL